MDRWMDERADIRRRNIDVRAVAHFRGMRRCSGDARDAIINSRRILRALILRGAAEAFGFLEIFHAPAYQSASLDFQTSKNNHTISRNNANREITCET